MVGYWSGDTSRLLILVHGLDLGRYWGGGSAGRFEASLGPFVPIMRDIYWYEVRRTVRLKASHLFVCVMVSNSPWLLGSQRWETGVKGGRCTSSGAQLRKVLLVDWEALRTALWRDRSQDTADVLESQAPASHSKV